MKQMLEARCFCSAAIPPRRDERAIHSLVLACSSCEHGPGRLIVLVVAELGADADHVRELARRRQTAIGSELRVRERARARLRKRSEPACILDEAKRRRHAEYQMDGCVAAVSVTCQ